MADEKVLSNSQFADFFQQPGTNPNIGSAPDLSNFLNQTGIKMSGLDQFLKSLDGQLSYYAERSPFQKLTKLFNV
ncbi:hypothetical protein [Desulfoscipio gibsoniae]|uniref:Uncharacterized protein n=1 Tax=Desulfoscipio gibsoniae DSM 7213 TaxID=767817 RepID=R4KMG6_9FIRM|nr:hypothetical protein [Desulfoscipio gibsoniae]AGL02752.1 hypothetical protein Desgi_3409 [Desulfoscipio gibsoniae DSM 7213]